MSAVITIRCAFARWAFFWCGSIVTAISPGSAPGRGEHVRPGLGPEPQKVFGHRRFLATLEVGHRLELVDFRAVQHEGIAFAVHAVGFGGVFGS